MVNRQQFLDMVERLRKDTEHCTNIEVTEGEDPFQEDSDAELMGDQVIFDIKYVSLDELGVITKKLKIHRFPEKFTDGNPIPVLGGKIVISELEKCPTCGHEKWKNVTREVQIKMLGGMVAGW